jgi:hypothetical protein
MAAVIADHDVPAQGAGSAGEDVEQGLHLPGGVRRRTEEVPRHKADHVRDLDARSF